MNHIYIFRDDSHFSAMKASILAVIIMAQLIYFFFRVKKNLKGLVS